MITALLAGDLVMQLLLLYCNTEHTKKYLNGTMRFRRQTPIIYEQFKLNGLLRGVLARDTALSSRGTGFESRINLYEDL